MNRTATSMTSPEISGTATLMERFVAVAAWLEIVVGTASGFPALCSFAAAPEG
jgi:hypothetical protein